MPGDRVGRETPPSIRQPGPPSTSILFLEFSVAAAVGAGAAVLGAGLVIFTPAAGAVAAPGLGKTQVHQVGDLDFATVFENTDRTDINSDRIAFCPVRNPL